MRKEILQRKTEVKNLSEDFDTQNHQLGIQTKELDAKAEDLEKLKVGHQGHLRLC